MHGPSRIASRPIDVKQITPVAGSRSGRLARDAAGRGATSRAGSSPSSWARSSCSWRSGSAAWWFLVRSDAEPKPKIEDTEVVAGGTLDGHWVVEAGSGSFVQYRVEEQFVGAVETEATGRTDQVAAEMTIDGPSVTDRERRRERREPQVGQGPARPRHPRRAACSPTRSRRRRSCSRSRSRSPQAPRKGEKVTTTASGDFTLHGITKPGDRRSRRPGGTARACR